MNIDFPFHIDNRQRVAVTSDNDHIPVHPLAGAGEQQLVFAGNSPELAATVQFMIQGNLQQYMGDLIDVASVQVDAVDSTLQVVVAYVVRRTAERQTASFSSSLGQGR